MTKATCFVIALIISTSCLAQDSASFKRKYDALTIYEDVWGHRLNGQRITQRELMKRLLGNEDSQFDARKWRQARLVTGIASAVAAGSLLYATTTRSDGNDDRTIIFGGIAFLVQAGVSFPFSIKARRHQQRAVWLYNRDVLARTF